VDPGNGRFCRRWGGEAKYLLFLAPENKSGFFARVVAQNDTSLSAQQAGA
jgi:hypothetical protein